MVSETEAMFTSAERLMEFEATTPVEAEAVVESMEEALTSTRWPSEGGITFDAVSARYRPGLPLVLRGLSVTVQPRHHVGIVGRTGSGKSSLALCLYRILEADEGRVVIDGIDIRSLGLRQLRSRLAIIPQDPVLFTGTLRYNLDPLAQATDAALWTALRRVHLSDFVESLSAGLDSDVAEQGDNLSAGQRQLVCFARALLRDARIIVLDEATAAVDHTTDALIQTTIAEEFKECTLLVIAHRLHTIMAYHRVLVLDAGRAAEYDHPAALLQRPHGLFSKLVRKTGAESAAALTQMAHDAWVDLYPDTPLPPHGEDFVLG